MTTQFSPNADPPTRFRPGPGQTGQAAALQALRPRATPGPKAAGGRARPGTAKPSGQTGGLGLPEMPQQSSGNGHLVHALHHANIQGLGRDVPFGIWAILNGKLPEMAPEGVEPFDWFEHA